MSIRGERLAMADSRAIEEQMERENPVQPLKKGTRKGRTSLVQHGGEYVGGGATPSMGVSQVRGGGRKKKEESPSEDGLAGGAIIGAGTKKGQTRKTARKAYEHTAGEMGKALSAHIHQLHGAGFWDDFKKGFMSVARPAAGIASMLPGAAGVAGKVASSLMGGGNVSGPGFEAVSGGVRTGRYEGKGRMEDFEKAAASLMAAGHNAHDTKRILMDEHKANKREAERAVAEVVRKEVNPRVTLANATPQERGALEGMLSMSYPKKGKGKLLIQHLPHGEGEEMIVGGAKKAKKVVGAGDKRRVRGQMVSKLMKEHGMTLAEASRHIKEHNLV